MVQKPFQSVVLWSLLPVSVTFIAIVIGPGFQWSQVHSHFLTVASSLMGTTALLLSRSEKHSGSQAVFMNFSIFFLGNGVAGPLQSILSKWFGFLHADMHTLMYQYYMPMYFLSLSISVVYLVMECMSRKSKVLGKYLATFLIVGAVWTPSFYPILSNPRYLYETKDMQDFRAVRNALEELRSNKHPYPSNREIAAAANLTTIKGRVPPLTETRVIDILRYMHENDYAILFFRPLWRSCAFISTFTVLFMVSFFSLRYFSDPPGGAYLEKIAWCILLFCVLEAIHYFHFMNVATWEIAMGFIRVGGYVSFAVMIPIGYLFGLRYMFVNSIEGSYYERQLGREASRITRWRDIVDNWVLRQFIVDTDLDRRFLVRGQGGEDSDGEKNTREH